MDAGGQHLVEHPGIGANRRLINAVDRHIYDHWRRAMPALGGAACDQSSHVFGQTLDVVRGVLHVIADVVGVCLGVFHALLITTCGA